MKLTLEFSADNAAFEDDSFTLEAASILRDAARQVTNGGPGGTLWDLNGNKVGSWSWDDPDAIAHRQGRQVLEG